MSGGTTRPARPHDPAVAPTGDGGAANGAGGGVPPSVVPSRRSVIVAVPARDEGAVLDRCLRAVMVAADRVRRCADVHVVVAAHDCRDDTEEVAARALAARHASIVRVHGGNVGAARAAAVQTATTVVGTVDTDRVWIAMTDADSVVPPHWLEVQLRAADHGADAVVGAVAVGNWSARSHPLDGALTRYRESQRRTGVRPVHGANLGVSASALAAVGGVPARALSEDAELVRRLTRSGHVVHWATDLVVRTSARRSSRAPGGFSTLLDRLEHGEVEAPPRGAVRGAPPQT